MRNNAKEKKLRLLLGGIKISHQNHDFSQIQPLWSARSFASPWTRSSSPAQTIHERRWFRFNQQSLTWSSRMAHTHATFVAKGTRCSVRWTSTWKITTQFQMQWALNVSSAKKNLRQSSNLPGIQRRAKNSIFMTHLTIWNIDWSW